MNSLTSSNEHKSYLCKCRWACTKHRLYGERPFECFKVSDICAICTQATRSIARTLAQFIQIFASTIYLYATKMPTRSAPQHLWCFLLLTRRELALVSLGIAFDDEIYGDHAHTDTVYATSGYCAGGNQQRENGFTPLLKIIWGLQSPNLPRKWPCGEACHEDTKSIHLTKSVP